MNLEKYGEVLNTGDIMEILRITRATAIKLVDTGKIKGIKVNKHRRIFKQDFIEFLEKNSTGK